MAYQAAAIPMTFSDLQGHSATVHLCSVRSLLQAGVQPTLNPSAEIFISVQCASPGRRGKLVGVCSVCARCVGWKKAEVGVSSLSGISKHAPSRHGDMTVWLSPDWHLFSASPDRHFFSAWPPD